jgi:signal transduction histidine kinase
MGERGATVLGLRKDGLEFPADAAISKLQIAGKRVLTVALRDITEQKRIENEQRFLAEAGPLLGTGLDSEQILCRLAELAVRDIADVCIVDVLEAGEESRQSKVVSRDPSKQSACEVFTRLPRDRQHKRLFASVLDTGTPLLMPDLTPDVIPSLVESEDHRQALRGLAVKSIVVVPLRSHGSSLGFVALMSSTRRYQPVDLRVAGELARRAALAIENARLYRAAERAIQARHDVLGIVAHDLRNPLARILMQATLLRREELKPGQPSQKCIEAIERAAKRMDRLIRDLLDVTRIEAGRLSIIPSAIPARQLVSDALETQKTLASSSSVELRLELQEGLGEVWADPERLLQVFENLIGNALQFTERQGRITVGAAPRDNQVLFWVADTGTGIAPEEVPHLFDRFWQGHKAGRQGAGLGLPIVKGVVEAHGGNVWVESAPGRGSTFFFTIPTPCGRSGNRSESAIRPPLATTPR